MIMHGNRVCHSADGLQTSRGESIRYVSPGGLNEQRTRNRKRDPTLFCGLEGGGASLVLLPLRESHCG